ncbi:MAG: hypothetical protein P8178_06805 [Candidatus Thiodiazotropha sp.]
MFGTHEIEGGFSAYYGLRTAYVKVSRDSSSNGTYGYSGSNEDDSGYTVSPTLGIDYRITDGLHACIEAEWNYSRLEGKRVVDTGEPEHYIERYDVVETDQNTDTRLLIRYFF